MLWKTIQKYLDKKRWSLSRLSRETGIPYGTLANYKFRKGQKYDPSFSNACKIADALGVSLDELREEKNNADLN